MFNMADRNKALMEEFRANQGKVGGRWEGRSLLILHTIGAKSGLERVNPTAYIRDGGRLVIIASKGGAPENPAWYHNLLAHPQITVEVGAETIQVTATVAKEPERTRLYDRMIESVPWFANYRTMTTRQIPVIILTPVK